jgi:hypothetical protein
MAGHGKVQGMDRVIIIAGPSRGKSTLADKLHRDHGWPVFCGDPASTVRYQHEYTSYLPEGLSFAGDGGAADWIMRHWFRMPGPWVCEGHAMARALRRWVDRPADSSWGEEELPCDRIILLDCPPHREVTARQEGMHLGVLRVWEEIAHHFEAITEVIRDPIPLG